MIQSNTVRVGAVTYLNTVPLVWGMLHGTQVSEVDLSFSIPSRCADRLREGSIDLGIVPVAEIARHQWTIVSEVGISCLGAVRSILLCSRSSFRNLKTLAADESSRTSVELARVVLAERYGCEPAIVPAAPDWRRMLEQADGALIIGDPALRMDPDTLGCNYLDLGQEWFRMTGLPMVFAAWASRPELADSNQAARFRQITLGSYKFGAQHLDEIVAAEYTHRGVSEELAREYLTRHIRFEIGEAERRGLLAFYELARLTRVMAV